MSLDVFIAIAGCVVTGVVIVAMILLTPRGVEPARRDPVPSAEPSRDAEPAAGAPGVA